MAAYRHVISTIPNAKFPAEASRYQLYVTLSCPFACRALAALYLKGLDAIVDVSVAHPVFQKTKPHEPEDSHLGWTFADPASDEPFVGFNGKEYPTEGTTSDPVNNVRFVRDLYELVDKEPRRYTVPLLWDKKKNTIVSSESADMVRIFDTGFGDLAPKAKFEIIPEAQKQQVEAANDRIVAEVGTGFYRVAVGPKLETYAKELAAFFVTIQKLDDLLATQRFIAGTESVSEADLRVFPTLVRFDYAQRAGFKYNLKDYPNIVNVSLSACPLS